MRPIWKIALADVAVVITAGIVVGFGILPPLPTLPTAFILMFIGNLFLLRGQSAPGRGPAEGASPIWQKSALVAVGLVYVAGACYGIYMVWLSGWELGYCVAVGAALTMTAVYLRPYAFRRRRRAGRRSGKNEEG